MHDLRPLRSGQAACGQQYVTKTVCVPELVTEERTCTETVCVPETHTRKVTCCEVVPVTKTVPCTYTVMVPHVREADGDVLRGRSRDAGSDRDVSGPGADLQDGGDQLHGLRSGLDRQDGGVYRVVPSCETRQGTRCETHCVPVKETRMQLRRPGALGRSAGHRACGPCQTVQSVRCWVPNWVSEPVEVTVNKLETVQVPCTYQVQVCKPQTQTRTVKVCHYESQVRTCSHQVCEFHCETRTRTCTVTECKFEQRTREVSVRRLRAEDRDPPAAGHDLRDAPGRADRALHRLGAAHGGEEGAGPGLQDGREDRPGPGLPAVLPALLPRALPAGAALRRLNVHITLRRDVLPPRRRIRHPNSQGGHEQNRSTREGLSQKAKDAKTQRRKGLDLRSQPLQIISI